MSQKQCVEEQVIEARNGSGAWYLIRLFGIAVAAVTPGVPSIWLWCVRETCQSGAAETYEDAVADALRAIAGLAILILQLALWIALLAG